MNDLHEWREQEKVFKWASMYDHEYPELKLLNGSLNGVRLTPGQASKAKRTGLVKGFPDINLPVPRGVFHGLFIELKRKKRPITKRRR